ncbi:Cofilin/actin-depolymerizing factor-like [Hondaea fermentalgiana]|uniref:Cofilin/actin-depolymerizing factor-like n=1 Tax=Hondaea fermentalgiana TaxID=2315210 RepID=A0A2R5GNI4_9STRA|nr:Cofilin/actin-depolymerizing factor-like [Hondaea fermentalgiana]|eukprot:GBG29871.1 Cofilin/actin-depolymerizing factor-like [Hondaea fermentalgiana]
MTEEKALYRVDEDVLAEYKKFKLGRKYRWVMFGVDEDGEGRVHRVKHVEADRSKGVDDLVAALPEHDCRYVVYEYEYTTSDGRKSDKLFFINWNPRSAPTATQMDYLTGRTAIREICEGCFDVSATTTNDVRTGVLGDDAQVESDQDEVDDDNDDWIDA